MTTNASTAQDQGEYGAEYDDLAAQFEDLKTRIAAIEDCVAERRTRCTELNGYLTALEGLSELLTEFDGRLWNMAVERVTVRADGAMAFQFRNRESIVWSHQ